MILFSRQISHGEQNASELAYQAWITIFIFPLKVWKIDDGMSITQTHDTTWTYSTKSLFTLLKLGSSMYIYLNFNGHTRVFFRGSTL